MKKWILAALLAIPCAASASEWYYFAKGDDGTLVYIDLSSYTSSQTAKKAWFSFIAPDGSTTKQLTGFKCASHESATLSFAEYGDDGKWLRGNTSKAPDYEPVVPDTVGSMMLGLVCRPNLRGSLLRFAEFVFSPKEHAQALRSPPSPEPAPPADGPQAPADCLGECLAGFIWAAGQKFSDYESCESAVTKEAKRGCTQRVWSVR